MQATSGNGKSRNPKSEIQKPKIHAKRSSRLQLIGTTTTLRTQSVGIANSLTLVCVEERRFFRHQKLNIIDCNANYCSSHFFISRSSQQQQQQQLVNHESLRRRSRHRSIRCIRHLCICTHHYRRNCHPHFLLLQWSNAIIIIIICTLHGRRCSSSLRSRSLHCRI